MGIDSKFSDKIALGLSCFILVTIPVIFAAVQPHILFFYMGCIFILFLIRLWSDHHRAHLLTALPVCIPCITFLVITLIQCLPLPLAILKYCSPVRHHHLVSSGALLGIKDSWHSISYNPYESLVWWAFILSLFLFFLILREYCASPKKLTLLVKLMLAVGVIESLCGLIQVLEPSVGVLGSDRYNHGLARGTFINRNHFAGYIGMLWPLGLGYILGRKIFCQNNLSEHQAEQTLKTIFVSTRFNQLIIFIFPLTMMLLTLIFSKSRTGIVSMAVGVFTFLGLIYSPKRKLSLVFRLIGGGTVALVIFYCSRMGLWPIVERFLKLADDTSRISMWKDGLALLKDHPFGVGLNNFKQVFPIYRVLSDSFAGRAIHQHNDYLQLLIESGWPGFVMLGGGFLTFLGRSFYKLRTFKGREHNFQTLLAIGAISGLVSMAFHSFSDFNLQIPANALYFITLLAIVHGCLWQNQNKYQRRKNYVSHQKHTKPEKSHCHLNARIANRRLWREYSHRTYIS